MAERRVGKNFGVVEAQILIWNKGLGYGLWKQKNNHI